MSDPSFDPSQHPLDREGTFGDLMHNVILSDEQMATVHALIVADRQAKLESMKTMKERIAIGDLAELARLFEPGGTVVVTPVVRRRNRVA